MSNPQVTVAGGGLAGMSAALRLAQRGYQVKLYEQKSMLGGNLASRPTPYGVDLDVYPHMFLSWYHNFWQLLAESGVDRDASFTEIESVKQLKEGDYPRFTGMTNGFSPRYAFQNLFSGVAPPADMFVSWYNTIDLLAEGLNPTMLLDNVSVTGFMQARPYMTERAAKTCDNFITLVWAIPSYLAAAEDYRTYLAYSVTNYEPPCLLANGPALDRVIRPLTTALENANVEIHREMQLTGLSCSNGRVTDISFTPATFDPSTYSWVPTGTELTEPVDELILAVPPQALSDVVRTGAPGHRLVEAVPKLAELARLRSQRIPILHVFFKRKLRHVPREPVGLYESPLALAFTDISQAWPGTPGFADHTVLSVSASDSYALPGTGADDDGYAIVRELADYLEFDPGTGWGDSPDIDWSRTRYESNTDSQLFINETGIDVWRPAAQCAGISNLCFAGNFCQNRIGMMTVESAVASGLEAARAIVKRRGGEPVDIIEPSAGNDLLYVWLRYAWAPYAVAAKAWSDGTDLLRGVWDMLMPTQAP